jgi:hypothetical protein
MKVPYSFAFRNVSAYTDAGAESKRILHLQAARFLRELAAHIGLPRGSYDVRSNKGGVAVSGEITLHGEHVYVQVYESCIRPGVGVM